MEQAGWLSGMLAKLRGSDASAPARATTGSGPGANRRPAHPGPGTTSGVPAASTPVAPATPTRPRRPVRVQMSAFLRQRIRERFLGGRFPGVPHSVEDLGQTDQVIKTARLFFEDGDVDRACEWLAFASDANPDERLWLAQLEILFLRRQGPAYAALAAEYRRRFPDSESWPDVARLGARLAPADPLFVGAKTADPDAHYGPWPQVQNWIEAPFDLTGDVLAAEFHAAMGGGGSVAISAKAP